MKVIHTTLHSYLQSYLLHYICDNQNSKCIKLNSVNPLYLMLNITNLYFEEINGNKYLTLVPTNQRKEEIKKYEELWIEIRDLIIFSN